MQSIHGGGSAVHPVLSHLSSKARIFFGENLAQTITWVFLFVNVDIDITFLVSPVAMAINGERESGSGQSSAGKNVLNGAR